jgi:hypothetical protein
MHCRTEFHSVLQRRAQNSRPRDAHDGGRGSRWSLTRTADRRRFACMCAREPGATIVLEPVLGNPLGGGLQEGDGAGASSDPRTASLPGHARASAAGSSEWDTSHKRASLPRTGTDPGARARTGARHRSPRRGPRPSRDDRGSRSQSSRGRFASREPSSVHLPLRARSLRCSRLTTS